MNETRKKLPRIAVTVALALVILLVIALVIQRLLPELIPLLRAGDEVDIEEYIRSFGSFKGALITAFLCFIQVVSIVFPGPAIWIAAGVVFGRWKAFVVCQAAFSAANTAVFALSRRLHGRLDKIFVSDADSKVLSFITSKGSPVFMVFLSYMIPLMPNGLIPYVAQRADMSAGRFAAAMTLGSIPQILVNCAVGNRILAGDWLIAGALFGSLYLVVALLYVFRGRLIAAYTEFYERRKNKS